MSLVIDVTNLVRECANQPQLYLEAAEAFAEANGKAKQDKAALEFAEATLALKIRANPEQFGFVKTTEGLVLELLKTDGGLERLRGVARESENAVAHTRARAEAFQQRSSMLKAEVELATFGMSTPQTEDARPQSTRTKAAALAEAAVAQKSKGRKRDGGATTDEQKI